MLRELWDLAAPVACAGCGRRTVPICSGCRAELARLARGETQPARPEPTPPGMPPTWALAPYAGALRQVIVAHKDDGRIALCVDLARLWRSAFAGALVHDGVLTKALVSGRLLVVPVPSSAAAQRTRGRDPWNEVVSTALAGVPYVDVAQALRVRRRVRDQSGLGAGQRAANLRGAMAVPGGLDLRDRVCVVSDDVVTTGATLVEAARALREAGAPSVHAVVLAATQRRGSG